MPCRILVVDDEASLRNAMADVLQQAGHTVATADCADSALVMLRNGPACQIVLCDVLMPGRNGIDLFDAVHGEFPELPIVLCTAVHDVHLATRAFRRGAFDFLCKPFQRLELLDVVERAVCHARSLAQTALYRHNLEATISERTRRLRDAMADLERSYELTLESMGDALDLRDEETQGHSKRVTAYSIALARAYGVRADDLRTIARGAFLHDMGKIATPDSILLKPGALTPDEMATMQDHCRVGYEMVRKIPFLAEAAEIVHAHQEKFDGTGYPRGLSGEEIPLGARIFAIADTLDAMTSDRPYRNACSFSEACREIERGAGTQFDPRIIEVFLDLPEVTWMDIRRAVGKNSRASELMRLLAA